MKRRLLALLLGCPMALGAQGLRISGMSSAQFVELRPLLVDSAGAEYSGALVTAAPMLNDLTLAAWGLTPGLSLHANVRVRTQLATDGLVYPRANDHMDVLDVYAELARGWGRARAGRQWITGGLGAYDFDGAALLLRHGTWSVEGWGGAALAAGLYASYAGSELAALENRPPDQAGYVVGARARVRAGPTNAASLMYQRVLRTDRHGMYSERAAFDGTARARGAVFASALTYDLASGDFNEARLRLGTAGARSWAVAAEVRHEQPFFELWTIWGAFAPVGFNEARGSVDWRPRTASVSLSAHGAFRRYGQTNAGLDLRTDGWRTGVAARWFGEGALSASGSYDVDLGFGASRSDARARVRWDRASGASLGLEGSALQNIYEFRIGTGRVFGAVIDAVVPLPFGARLAFDGGFYRHARSHGAIGPDWTQRRASLRLEWTLGRDPGIAGAGKSP